MCRAATRCHKVTLGNDIMPQWVLFHLIKYTAYCISIVSSRDQTPSRGLNTLPRSLGSSWEPMLTEHKRESLLRIMCPGRQPTPKKCSVCWTSQRVPLELGPASDKYTIISYKQLSLASAGSRYYLDTEKAPCGCAVRFSGDLLCPRLTPTSFFLAVMQL